MIGRKPRATPSGLRSPELRPLDLAVGLMLSAGAALAFYIPTATPVVRAPEAPCVAVTVIPAPMGQGVDYDGREDAGKASGVIFGYSSAEDGRIWNREGCE